MTCKEDKAALAKEALQDLTDQGLIPGACDLADDCGGRRKMDLKPRR